MLFTDKAHGNFAKDPAVVKFHNKYYLYYSLKYEDERFGVGIAASADLENWEICEEVPLEENYEKNGIAAPGAIVLNDEVHLFYQTYDNGKRDAICHAISRDGIFFTRIFQQPFLPCGAPDAWNSSESGHPYIFPDEDGRIYLIYQGSSDNGVTWYLSKEEVVFENGVPKLISK